MIAHAYMYKKNGELSHCSPNGFFSTTKIVNIEKTHLVYLVLFFNIFHNSGLYY